jgi:hypothetical protein
MSREMVAIIDDWAGGQRVRQKWRCNDGRVHSLESVGCGKKI